MIEELADGIIQITSEKVWDADAWEGARAFVVERSSEQQPLYVLYNLSGALHMDQSAFSNFLAAPQHAQPGLAILVARKTHLRLARQLIKELPNPDAVRLRLMPQIDIALNILLDRQVMDRINTSKDP